MSTVNYFELLSKKTQLFKEWEKIEQQKMRAQEDAERKEIEKATKELQKVNCKNSLHVAL